MFEHVEDVEGFAAALHRVRRHAGLSYRQLADRAHYSHPHLIRAANGKQLPTWDVAAAYLTGCGVSADLLPVWHRRWQEATRDPRDVVGLLDSAETLEALGTAVTALVRPRSLRTLEQLTGIPRATIQAWLQGTRLPNRDRLDHLVRTVGATRAERTAVAEAVDRLATLRISTVGVGTGQLGAGGQRVSSGRLRPAPAA
jgi:transcriptional regulator with XRE-family HTH domain